MITYPVNSKQKQPPEVFCKKCVFKNFAKFTGKHLCQILFLLKLQILGLQACRPKTGNF